MTVEILRRAESGIDIFGWQTPELFGLTQAGLCVLILLVMYRRPSGIFARLELGEAAIRRWFGRRGAAPVASAPAMAMPPAGELRAEGVAKNFAGLRALDGVDLSLRPGEIVGLIGPNGSGKTTLLNIISGLFAPSDGRILIDGGDATRWPAHDVARAGIGRTFQNIRLFGQLSVLENVEISARAAPGPAAGFDPHAFALPAAGASSASPILPTARPRRSTTAPSAGSRSRGRWRSGRATCSSTSRRPA